LTILSLPTFSRTAPSFQTFSLMPNTASFTSPLNGTVQTSELPGARWVSTFGWNGLTDLDVRILKAWLNKLSGRAGRFYLTDYTHKIPSGTAQGSPVVNGASQTGRTLITSGWTPNQTALLLPGDYFSVGSQLCVITETASADGSGNTTLTFEPPLRSSPASRTLSSELLTDAGFATGTGWSNQGGWTVSGGVASCDGTTANSTIYQAATITAGLKYEITYTVVSVTSGTGFTARIGGVSGTTRNAPGTYTEVITATTSNGGVRSVNNTVGSIDNVSIKQVLNESDVIVTSSPKCVMMLEDDKQDNFPFQEKNNSSVTIKCLEMF